MTDIDELERLHAEHLKGLAAGTWSDEDNDYCGAIIRVFDVSDFGEEEDAGNGAASEYADDAAADTAKAAVACLNALPGLIAELRAAREALTKISAIRDSIVGLQGFNFSEHARDNLRAALAKVPK